MNKSILLYCLLLFLHIGCRKEKTVELPKEEIKPFYAPSTVLENPEKEPTYKEDTITLYEYRIGKSGDYTYNYDVIGKDKEENVVEGNITIKDKYGNGKLTDSNGKTFVVTVEWIEYGKLLAKDEKENEYILLVK
jgi:hypothetical protein